MTTENGLTRPKEIRAAINVLLERRVWLIGKQDERQALGEPDSFLVREIAAIEVALPLLEAEWDYATRMWAEERVRMNRLPREDVSA